MEEYRLPVIILHGVTMLPGMIMHFDLQRKGDMEAVEKAFSTGQSVLIACGTTVPEEGKKTPPSLEDMLPIGLRSRVKQLIRLPGGTTRALVEGMDRARILDLQDEGFLIADIKVVKEGNPSFPAEVSMPASIEDEARYEAMLRELKERFAEYCAAFPKVGENMLRTLPDIIRLDEAIDKAALQLPLGHEDRQALLLATDLDERYAILIGYLMNERNIAEIRQEIAVRMQEKLDENQRSYILREQLSYLQEELDKGEELSETEEMRESLSKLEASEEVKAKIEKVIARYEKYNFSNSEASVERGYIETLLELPWDKTVPENKDLLHAEEVLEKDHYGLEKIKERVLEFLAVRARKTDGKSPILCLVGPPGTGKTSVVKSVAKALELPYERICLGGVRDEAEIRGHRKTYIGAMPGRITKALIQAKAANPVILLDEIDKVGSDYKGDPASALLELLDGEQNVAFSDHYIEIPMDLSRVLFVATANTTDTIPRPLLDRMEVIE
ncbi:MAG: AAA family ATPase, partial [Lachnospiraceae bacterium]|nr:AAA family ATPase [Lachnospiraceae bacterium]